MAVVADVGERLDVRARQLCLAAEVLPGAVRRNEVRLDLRPRGERLEEAGAEEDAARAADADDEAAGRMSRVLPP